MTDPSMVATSSAGPDAASEYPMLRGAGCPFDPASALRRLQAEARITRVRLWDGSTPWLVTGYHDQRALLLDRRVSVDPGHPHYPHLSAALKHIRGQAPTFVNMDDPDHARLRRMVTAPFVVKRMETLRPAIQAIVDDRIDAILAGPPPVDLVTEFAMPVPSLVICALLGVPYADHDFFQSNSRAMITRSSTPEQAGEAMHRLLDYLDRLVGERLADPEDDLLSMLAERVRAGELSRREAARTGRVLLTAGHETTANMIALGTLALLEHPDQLAEVRETDDPKLIGGAVEELLRYLTITQAGRLRVALEDIDVGGLTIRAGEGMIFPTDIGNRDPAAFRDPDRLDIHRDGRHHLAFGFGVHQCLGQPLARMELQVVYGTLFRRIPTLRLATDFHDLPFKHDSVLYGVDALPVTW
jgi:cytochrome P450